jgi:leucyl-tRNA synthetase
MSKSKRNTVDPTRILEGYGADTARLFMLSDSPPDRDLEWTDTGIDGAFRYVNRVWRLIDDASPPSRPRHAGPADLPPAAAELRRQVHRAIAQVTGRDRAPPLQQGGGAGPRALERGRGLRHRGRGTTAATAAAMREAVETLVLLLGP